MVVLISFLKKVCHVGGELVFETLPVKILSNLSFLRPVLTIGKYITDERVRVVIATHSRFVGVK